MHSMETNQRNLSVLSEAHRTDRMAARLHPTFLAIARTCSPLRLVTAMMIYFCLLSPAYPPSFFAFGYEATAHNAPLGWQSDNPSEIPLENVHSTDPSKEFSPNILEELLPSLDIGHGHSDTENANERSRKVKLVRHSFESPLSKDASPFGELDWILKKASVPTKKYVMLLPSLINRSGQLWNKLPMRTTNFQIFFSFEIMGNDESEEMYPEGFALWVVYEPFVINSTSSLQVGVPHGDLFGYKANPKGLGVFFKFRDLNGNLNPSISAIYNDGNRHISSVEIPTRDGIYYDFRYPNTKTSGIFQLSAGPNGVYGQIRTRETEWVTCFEMKDLHLEPNSYMGFSALSSSSSAPVTPVAIAIYSVLSYNLDLSVSGEENPDVQTAFHETEVGDLLHNHSHYKNEVELADAMRQLSRLIYQQIADQASRESQILRIVRSLLVKIQHLEFSLTDIQAVSHKEPSDNSSAYNSIRNEMSGLMTLLHKHTEKHSDTLHLLHDKIDSKLDGETAASNELKELARNAKILEDTIHSRHSISSFMIVFLIVIVCLFGIFMWKRFRDMEKKHFL
ncbi:lectin family protein [Cardiosporidium cionae]|uniref:Lectin family protein n=1 Tax=Cardiosporidium cionae TaxID=476202 RepID=A0ABQ7JAN6_9APIC|nr:lectin family protein [Cardiosporidium cionae]|eukprot:KAF8821029.1 lectin family protein [Cardiosporidium cionae]